MNRTETPGKARFTLFYTGLFALAMAYLESAVVVYLRRVYGISELTQALSAFDPYISAIEMGREAATLVMLLAVGWIAGRNLQSRIGYLIFTFGLWDIFYYAWLKVFLNWPATILDTDLLFLIPLPWWGPVLAPTILALIMAVVGIRMVILDQRGIQVRFQWWNWILLSGGILIVLYAFMAGALSALPCSTPVLAQILPSGFRWPIFVLGVAMSFIALSRVMFPWGNSEQIEKGE